MLNPSTELPISLSQQIKLTYTRLAISSVSQKSYFINVADIKTAI